MKVGTGNVHQLMNPGSEEAHYLEVPLATASAILMTTYS
ncbi:putative cupin superfamily protein [Erwinia persicina]|nr:putative cupin superfamily protein [Erwinia persicina]